MRFEFDNYHKFLVSVGTGLIALAGLSYWLLLTNPLDFQITQATFDSLTPQGQAAIEIRQRILLYGITNAWTAVLLGLPGLVFLIWGISGWRKSQHLIDKIESLESKARIRQLSSAEVVSRIDKEIQEDIPGDKADPNNVGSDSHFTVKSIIDYAAIEHDISTAFHKCLKETHRLEQNLKVEDVAIDAVLFPSSKRRRTLLLEVKYYSHEPSQSQMSLVVRKTEGAASVYGYSTFHPCHHATVFVMPRAMLRSAAIQTIERNPAIISSGKSPLESQLIMFVAEEDVKSLDCEAIKSSLNGKSLDQWLQN